MHISKKQAFMYLGLFILHFLLGSTYAETNPADAEALRNLYTSLYSPSQLTGWKASEGDPCLESWHGVQCSGTAVTQIMLSGLGLTGNLGYELAQLTSLLNMDLSNNHVTGSLPYQLPPNLRTLNLANNGFSGDSLPYSLSLMTNLTSLNVGNNQLSGSITDVFQNLVQLSTLDMSFNHLTGSLPQGFSSLSSLSVLHLQNNQLSGDLNLLAFLPLQDLNVENNHFTGWIPSTLSSIPALIDGGNSFNSSAAPPPPAYAAPPYRKPINSGHKAKPFGSPKTHRNIDTSTNSGAIAGIVVAGILAAIIIVLIIGFFLWKSRGEATDEEKQKAKSVVVAALKPPPAKEKPEPENKSLVSDAVLKPPPLEKLVIPCENTNGKKAISRRIKSPITAIAYSVADLQVATSSFSQENLIGEGALGRVYRAEIPNGKLLAVKKIDTSSSSIERDEDFVEIVSNISRLRHPNVTELVGYCTEHSQRLLVYKYFGKGTLHERLHTRDEMSKRELTWNIRVKIALGTARALEYLHEVCLPAVIHKNFKSANILLDEELNPHLSDCGVAAFIRSPERKVSTQMICSFGYSAPEYAMSGIYTVKSDVYSFGVVMLELLTGRKPLDSERPRAEQSLVRWATPQLHDIDALAKMVDVTLQGMYPAKSLSRFADIIALCVQPAPEFRPPMSEVVQSLVRLMQRTTMNKRRSGDEPRNIDTSDPVNISF